MSIAEVAPKNALENEQGLTPQQNKEARVLYWKANYAKGNQIRGKHDRKYEPTYTSGISRPFDVVADTMRVRGAIKKAEEHYKANEAGYQIQAVHDAAAENVHTDFGKE